MRIETITLNETRNVTLTAYLQETGGEFRNIIKRPAMVILPGGGYQFCSRITSYNVCYTKLLRGKSDAGETTAIPRRAG